MRTTRQKQSGRGSLAALCKLCEAGLEAVLSRLGWRLPEGAKGLEEKSERKAVRPPLSADHVRNDLNLPLSSQS